MGGGKRGRQAGFPGWREVGEIRKNYPTLRNIAQTDKVLRGESLQKRAGTGIKGYGKREF